MPKSLIYQVDDVSVVLKKSNPPQLGIQARGIVPTKGWSNPELSPYYYVTPPADGIQDFSFLAQPPHKNVPEVLTPIRAEQTVRNSPSWVRGVRVHSSTNCQEAVIGQSAGLLSLMETPAREGALPQAVNLKVMVVKNDLAYTWWVVLEGQTFYPPQFQHNGKMWLLTLPGFPVQGTLDVILHGTGSDNGVQRGRVAARLESDGKLLTPDLHLQTIKMYGIDQKSYQV